MSSSPTSLPTSMRQFRSLVTTDGQLELSIVSTELPTPAASEVLVRVEAGILGLTIQRSARAGAPEVAW